MSDNKVLASPQSIVWCYYECLIRQLARVPEDEYDRTAKQELALSLFLAVIVVESFINIFFRVVVGESEFKNSESMLLNDIKRRISLEGKLKKWPKEILGYPLDLSKGAVNKFVQLKNHRNLLMHFDSSHESLTLPDSIKLTGLSDMTPLESLCLSSAKEYP